MSPIDPSKNAVMLTPLSTAVEDSPDKALVLVQGYMTEKDASTVENDKWLEELRLAGWQAPVMQLQWDSGHVGQLIRDVGAVAMLRLGAKLAARRVAFPLPPIGLYELAQLHNHWARASRGADEVDVHAVITSLKEEYPSGSVSLMGHSLGAKVVVNLLEAAPSHDYKFHDAILLGGALSRRDERLADVAEDLEGQFLNVHHSGDRVLQWLYKAGELTRFSPAGLKPILVEHPTIENIDATPHLKASFRSHVSYTKILKQLVGDALWSPKRELEK